MLYPVYIHNDDNSAFGMIVADFPGCYAASDDFDGIPAAVQESVELYFADELRSVPLPTSPAHFSGAAFTGGLWALIDIDLTKLK
ncbi:type II toxin-antitoxin system HicB family antitoxin [Parahaliea mediterranea]|uniref:type II toxin-antitoxin system HicB family antitoxin n=1 Tax=Parahaliea mediterranea TaxID=651086 RepID=UPI000E2EF399|nr:type II toxin-antitoxin system HicB family antitoxin [Parahaliea mediterranea]